MKEPRGEGGDEAHARARRAERHLVAELAVEGVGERAGVGDDRDGPARLARALEEQPRVRALLLRLRQRGLEREAPLANEGGRRGEDGRLAGRVEVQAARVVAAPRPEAGDPDAVEVRRLEAEGLLPLGAAEVVVQRRQGPGQEPVAAARAVPGGDVGRALVPEGTDGHDHERGRGHERDAQDAAPGAEREPAQAEAGDAAHGEGAARPPGHELAREEEGGGQQERPGAEEARGVGQRAEAGGGRQGEGGRPEGHGAPEAPAGRGGLPRLRGRPRGARGETAGAGRGASTPRRGRRRGRRRGPRGGATTAGGGGRGRGCRGRPPTACAGPRARGRRSPRRRARRGGLRGRPARAPRPGSGGAGEPR